MPSAENRWVNDYDQPLNFVCSERASINYISSVHSNSKEDRVWDFTCRTTFQQSPTCYWTNYVNEFDEAFSFTCPLDGVINGLSSYHDNHREDRRWKFHCCSLKNICNSQCYWTGYVNEFDEHLSFAVPEGYVLTGMSSYHDNKKEDRRWMYNYCSQRSC
ncbi:hemagglutinin/amebocyte aggregation factor-like [Protopterus annectens]|uniref:hemagglutinin/amebocyte aggregation factor-like n=1 Tax=Protopterus annectens TaxID=7888 RepID=UPI001CFBAD15|nr:hemagglutinin/amebocyte aggregation factor-like [Protopterus annectens]XP_043939035.1 hemagglutinin/amebocyte aggregation factor-like [Protopterus annectens]